MILCIRCTCIALTNHIHVAIHYATLHSGWKYRSGIYFHVTESNKSRKPLNKAEALLADKLFPYLIRSMDSWQYTIEYFLWCTKKTVYIFLHCSMMNINFSTGHFIKLIRIVSTCYTHRLNMSIGYYGQRKRNIIYAKSQQLWLAGIP